MVLPGLPLVRAQDASKRVAQLDGFNKQCPGHPEIVDRAHMNRKGAAFLGGFVAEELAKVVPGLAKSVQVQR